MQPAKERIELNYKRPFADEIVVGKRPFTCACQNKDELLGIDIVFNKEIGKIIGQDGSLV